MRVALRALLLALLLAAAARADGPRVRITLRDGSEVEGELVDFQARTYRVVLAGGARREVPEKDVLGLVFPEGPADASPVRALARALRAAAGSGVLAQRIPAEQGWLLREGTFSGEGPLEARFPRSSTVEALARVRARLEGEELSLGLEVVAAAPGVELHSFGLGPLPARLAARVGLDGRLRALRLERPGAGHDLAPAEPAADALPELLAALLLPPLHDQGLPEQLRFAALRPGGGGPEPWSLLLLPADGLALARTVRLEPGPGTTAGALDLTVGLRGADRGRLIGWRGRSGAPGMRSEAVEIGAERLAPAAWEERLKTSKVAAEVPAPPPGPREPSRLGELFAAAEAAGRVEAALGERWLRWEEPGRLIRAVRVVLRRDAGGIRIEVAHQSLFRSDALELVCRLGPAGLTWLRLGEPDHGLKLRGLLVAGPDGALAGSARGLGWKDGELLPIPPLSREAVPALLARFALPLLLAPEDRLELPCLEEASLASPLGLAVRTRAVGPDWPAWVRPAEQAALVAEHEQEGEAARSGNQEAAQRNQAALIGALRAVAAAQAARSGAGRGPAGSLGELGVVEPAGWQLEVRTGPEGRWLALAWPLDQAVGYAGAWAIGPDGQVQRAHETFALQPDGSLPAGFAPWRR